MLLTVETRATVGKNLSLIWLQFPPLSCLIRLNHPVDNGIDRAAYGDPEACFSTFIWWKVISARQYHRAATGLNWKEYGKVFLRFFFNDKARYGCSLLFLHAVFTGRPIFLIYEALIPQNGQLHKLSWKSECQILLSLQNPLSDRIPCSFEWQGEGFTLKIDR